MTEKKIPMRKCIGCNEMKEKKALIRIVRSNVGEFNVDVTGKLAGRGAYICNCRECFDTAVKAKRLERAFKTKIPESVFVVLREKIEGGR